MTQSNDSQYAQTDAEFIRMLYRVALGREPEPGITEVFVDNLRNGIWTRPSFVQAMLDAGEFKARLATQMAEAEASPQIRPLWHMLVQGAQ